MKAMTLHQPWASLAILGAMPYVTQRWSTTHRGVLAIHAGPDIPSYALEFAEAEEEALSKAGIADVLELPVGAILGVVRLDDCIPADGTAALRCSARERAWCSWGSGRFAFRLAGPARYAKPIRAAGAAMIWNWAPPSVGSG